MKLGSCLYLGQLCGKRHGFVPVEPQLVCFAPFLTGFWKLESSYLKVQQQPIVHCPSVRRKLTKQALSSVGSHK